LKASKDYFKSLLQNASDITLVLSEAGDFKYITPSFYRITGFQSEHLIGKKIFDFVHPEDLGEAMDNFRISKGEQKKSGLFKFRCKKREGDYLILEAVCTNLLDDENVKGF